MKPIGWSSVRQVRRTSPVCASPVPCTSVPLPVLLLTLLLLLTACQATPAPAVLPSTTLVPTVVPSTIPIALPTLPASPVSPTRAPTPLPAATPDAAYLPAQIAALPLATEAMGLAHLLADPEGGRLYVTDSAGLLHILDATTLAELAAFPVAGSWDPGFPANGTLLLDAANDRLYVGVESPPSGTVTLVDTAALQVVASVTPGGVLSLDPDRGRLYAGRAEGHNPLWEQRWSGVYQASGKVYDAATLAEVGDLPVPGTPVYDPLADELLIVAYTVHRVDPDTLAVSGDLLPDVSAQPCPECSGARSAAGAEVDVDRNVITVHMAVSIAGHKPPVDPDNRYFDATTLEPVPDPHLTPPLQPACNDRRPLPAAVRDRAYYRPPRANWLPPEFAVLALDATHIITVTGVELGPINPNTCQSYVTTVDGTVVFDLPTLTAVGSLPRAEYTLDAASGRLYGLAGRDLLVFSESGGRAAAAPPEPVALPPGPVNLIAPSPTYEEDLTLFLGVAPDRGYPFDRRHTLYRSTDGGETWYALGAGLPVGGSYGLHLALSPQFASDRTLFAGGFYTLFNMSGPNADVGTGVYRSTDGGDTWQLVTPGIGPLLVDQLVVSPDLARDGLLVAYARTDPRAGVSTRSAYYSTDGGDTWSRSAGGAARGLVDLLPAGPDGPWVEFRLNPDLPPGVDRLAAGAGTWQRVFTAEGDDSTPVAVLPTLASRGQPVYLLGRTGLWRSADLGDTWQRCPDDRIDGRPFDAWVAAGALAGTRLLAGTLAGELLSLDLEGLSCAPPPCAPAAGATTLLAGQWVRRIAPAPATWAGPGEGGDVWLATQDGHVYRYADGAIHEGYATADEMHSRDPWGLALARGALWVAGQDDLHIAVFDGESWADHTPALPGVSPWVVDLATAPDGTPWAVAVVNPPEGAPEGALLRWTGAEWARIADPDHSLAGLVYDVAFTPDGGVWVATIRGVARYSGGAWGASDLGECGGVAAGARGEVVAVVTGDIVWHHDGAVWTRLPAPPTGPPGFRAIYVARDGAVWVAAIEGVARYDGQAWRQITHAGGLPLGQVEEIAEDASGRMWFGTINGAVVVEPATLGVSGE